MAEASRFALLGHPVGHSISPAIHRAALSALGLPHTYEVIDVPSHEALAAALAALRAGDIAGVNVTVPHKRAVLAMVDEVAPSAEEVGAANVICRAAGASRGSARLVAHNTDAGALSAELSLARAVSRGRVAAVLGAGGASLAAVVALRRLGFEAIGVTTRSWPSASEVASSPSAERLRALGAVPVPFPHPFAPPLPLPASAPASAPAPAPASASASASASGSGIPHPQRSAPMADAPWPAWIERAAVILQATSAGMHGASPGEDIASAVPWDRVQSGALAYDVIYNPPVTPFLREAQSRSLDAVGGLGMLVRQAALSFALWTGIEPPIAIMRAAAEDAMATAGHSR